MAWVLVTGEDDAIYHGVTRVVRREGCEVGGDARRRHCLAAAGGHRACRMSSCC